MSELPYLSPSERFYRGEISREEARVEVLANVRRTRKVTGSPELNRILRVAGMLFFPILLVIDSLTSRRQ
ncbi:MAG: hypothetical protein JJE51_13105 [Thermoanaerobaculia bacterium]|nr:hypothetical protein [Thermoanaerobaculia bacterium]